MDNFLSDIELVVILVSRNEIKDQQVLLNDKIVFDTKNIILSGEKVYRL